MSVCPVPAVNFKCLDLESLFLVCGYFFGKSLSYQGHQAKVRVTGSKSMYAATWPEVCIRLNGSLVENASVLEVIG